MWPFGSKEARGSSSPENASIPVSAENFLAFFGVQSHKLPAVDVYSALQVPAVWAAVMFLSRTLATVPLHAFRKTDGGPKKLSGKIETVVGFAPNDYQDTFKFRQYFWQQVFTHGRGLAWIDRTPQGVEALWPMDPTRTVIKRTFGKVVYQFNDIETETYKEYPSEDVIDIPFALRHCGLYHYSPIIMGAKAIQLALAMNEYGSNFFAGGGVPPLAMTGPLPQGGEAMKRATNEIFRAIDAAKSSDKPIFGLPPGHDLKPVGFDPEKGQMTDARRFQIEEIARVYQMPPVFLQDLTNGTFSNTEQQDLFFVKHLISQWSSALEGELNLKIFGRGNNSRYVRHDLDGLLRGDLLSRMTALSKGVQTAIYTPDEAREKENLPKQPNGDKLYIQGATAPLGTQTYGQQENEPAADNSNLESGKQAA